MAHKPGSLFEKHKAKMKKKTKATSKRVMSGAAYAFDADNTFGKTSPTMARSTPQAVLKKKSKKKKRNKKMTLAQDTAYDKKHGIKEGSKRDIRTDKLHGVKDKKK